MDTYLAIVAGIKFIAWIAMTYLSYDVTRICYVIYVGSGIAIRNRGKIDD